MFRTIEISDLQFECNNLRFITVKTANLKGRGDICVFVPPGNDSARIPLVILLHGVYGGTEDPLIDQNRYLHRCLTEEKIQHEYHEFPGGHEWPYWQKYIRKSLLFFNNKI